MHTAVNLTSIVLVLLSGYGLLGGLPRVERWSYRRRLQLVILGAPIVSLGVTLSGLHHFVGRACCRGTPTWDHVLGVALPLAMVVVALGGVGLGMVRLVLMQRVIARSGAPVDLLLQALAERLADRLGTSRPRVLLVTYDRPVAYACGIRQPTLLLSTWMVEHLDRREIESVLAHEIGHVARRDYLVVWLTTVLRDAFFYLPTSWGAYRQLRCDKELACDDLAVGATHQPLALASALAKVWEQLLSRPSLTVAQALVETSETIEGRIARLLATDSPTTPRPSSPRLGLGLGVIVVAGMLVLEAAHLAVLIAPLSCGPASWLGRVL